MNTGETLVLVVMAAFLTLGGLFLIVRAAVLSAMREALKEHRRARAKVTESVGT